MEINLNVSIGLTPELRELLTSALLGKRTQEPRVTAPETQEAVKAEAAQQVTTAKEPKTAGYPTEADVREAMRRERIRFEGEDYETNPNSEGRKNYHKQLTSTFKALAATLGHDKPSDLPQEKRQAFIDMCGELTAVNGVITVQEVPF